MFGTFQEFFRDCPGCQQQTRWAFFESNVYIEGECEECEYTENFDTWDEVMDVVVSE